MKKNILLMSHFAGSSRHGMVLRNYLIAKEWVRQGHSVTILASDFSHYRPIQPDTRIDGRHENIDGIEYSWQRGFRYHADSALGRVLAMSLFTAECYLFAATSRRKFDVVVASSPHPFVIYPAAKLARRQGASLVYDIRDLWPLTPVHLGGYSVRHPFIRALQHAEDYACRNADLVIAVQGNAEKYLCERGLEPGRFLEVANGVSTSVDNEREALRQDYAELLKAIGVQNGFLIGYCGTLGRANAMQLLLEALPNALPNVHLAILGDGPHKEELVQITESRGLTSRVHFLDPVPKSQVYAFLRLMDATYVGGHPSPLYRYGASPTKLNDYMTAGKPIIYGLGDPGNAVQSSGAGIEYEPGSAQALTAAINAMASLDHCALREMGELGKTWAQQNRCLGKASARVLERLDELGPRKG